MACARSGVRAGQWTEAHQTISILDVVTLDIGNRRDQLQPAAQVFPGYSRIIHHLLLPSAFPSQLSVQRRTYEHAAVWRPGKPDRYWAEQGRAEETGLG